MPAARLGDLEQQSGIGEEFTWTPNSKSTELLLSLPYCTAAKHGPSTDAMKNK